MKNITRPILYFLAGFIALSVPAAVIFSGAVELPEHISLAQSDTQKVFNAAHYRLDNGLEVVVIENHRAPVVTHMVWYKVGAADETTGKSGIAHFMEHLMFKGSEGLAPGEFSEIIRSLGGNDNAFTAQDYTAYFQSIAKEHLATVMTMEAGRMRGMNPPESEILSERQVILEERAQRTDNNPQARFGEQMDAALYTNHPYGTPVIGWRHEMEDLTREDAMDFYNRWYAPNNAILVVSGDVTGEEVLALAQKIYGGLEVADTPKRERTLSPPMLGENIIRMSHETIREPLIQMAYRAPSMRQDYKTALALEVLGDIMGGGSSSRLYQSLVVEQKIAANAGLYYRGDIWDDGEVLLYATPLPEQDLETLRDALHAELRKLIRDGISDTELSESIARLQAGAIFARDSLAGPAMLVGRAIATGQSLDQVEYWPQNLEHVTARDVQNAAKLYLNPDAPRDIPPVIGYLTPETEAAQ